MKSNTSASKSPSVNIISKGSQLTGGLSTQSDVRIAGSLEGEVASESKVIVSSSGELRGNLDAKEADIAGKITGELSVAEKLIVRKSALIDGDIYTKSILVEEGAKINGACNMGDQERIKNKPSKSSPKTNGSPSPSEKKKIEATG